jgi:hypothetical protein
MPRPILHIADILAWADAFHEERGRWPTKSDGPIPGHLESTWSGVDAALKCGNRGLRPGSSLAKLLLKHRGRRHKGLLPHYTVEQVLAWADAYHKRTGAWSTYDDGPIVNAPGETWHAVDAALRKGMRGLPGCSSLAQLLSEQRGVRNIKALPRFTKKQVLAWADAYHARTGSWPTRESGPIPEAPEENWTIIDTSLTRGSRGLPRCGSLPQFLSKHRGVRNPGRLPSLSVREILTWADAYHERTGRWPMYSSGPIPEAPGETWARIHAALQQGHRGFPGGSSLYRLLRKHGRRRSRTQPRLRHS